MAVFLGLDCGGSSCRAISVNSSGDILHQGQSGPANLANTPTGRLFSHIRRASESQSNPDFVCGCFAGLLTEEDRIRAKDILKSVFPAAAVRTEPDYFAALRASEGADMCVIAGTGSVVCSHVDGKLAKSGGRGYLLGDVGSAFQFGRSALLHFLEVGPNRISPELAHAIEQKFGSLNENEVLARLYRGGLPAAQLAKLAGAFAKDAKANAPYALSTLESQMNSLVSVTQKHIDTFHSVRRSLSVCLAGGLWEGSSIFRNAFIEKLRPMYPEREITISRISRPPVYGAVELAKELAI